MRVSRMVVPVLATFFFAFGMLEDSGYLPRLSVLLDRALRKIGLNGKGILPLVLGFSCITMAILTTRILDTRRERFIATLLLTLGLPCAPLLAVMLVLLADMSFWASLTVFGGTTRITTNWSPAFPRALRIPLPRRRSLEPPAVPAGIFSCTGLVSVGTSILTPRAASVIETGTST